MVLERTIVDRVNRAPAFVQMFPSSEVTPSALSPGLKPTIASPGDHPTGELVTAPAQVAGLRNRPRA